MVVELQGTVGSALGVLHIPDVISDQLIGSEYENIKSGERLVLPIALGLGLILAGLTDTDFILSGDRSVWKETWGTLLQRSESTPLH
jgi:hypothetical protein